MGDEIHANITCTDIDSNNIVQIDDLASSLEQLHLGPSYHSIDVYQPRRRPRRRTRRSRDKPAAVEGHAMAAQMNQAAGLAVGEDEQAQGTESGNQADGSYRRQQFWSGKGDKAREIGRASCRERVS